MAHDIFISYSTDDQKIVEGLSAYLEQNGIRCFVAYRDIPKGIDWAGAVTTAIENSRLMVVVFSEHFNQSKHVDREIALCIQEGKPILTFKIQNTTFTGTKKYYLQNLNWIDAFPNPEKYFGDLCDNILKILPGIRAKRTKQDISENIRPESQMSERTSLEGFEQNLKKKNLSKRGYYVLGGILTIILLCLLIILYKKSGDNPSITSKSTADTVFIIQPKTMNSPDTNNVSNTTKKSNTSNTSDTIKKRIATEESIITNYEHADTLISESGERYPVAAGDIFLGTMKSGKIIQGIIKDKAGNAKHLILPKRNL